jgi:hypothetical protein
MTFMTRQPQRDLRPSVREPASQPVSQSAPKPASTPVPSQPPPSRSPVREPDATNVLDASAIPALVIEASTASSRIGQRLELTTFPFTLGRSLEFLSTENEVSRRHAEITREAGGRYYITDLQSTNGVTINGQHISPNVPQQLTPGARVGLGTILVMRFEA